MLYALNAESWNYLLQRLHGLCMSNTIETKYGPALLLHCLLLQYCGQPIMFHPEKKTAWKAVEEVTSTFFILSQIQPLV